MSRDEIELPSDAEISDSYIYLLGRLLILNQQQADFAGDFVWNRIVHREPGNVAWPNPNLDVAYSEAWVAIDDVSYLLVGVPEITDRYYTIQFLNGWGETVANINERVFPDHPSGEFAVCLKDAQFDIPPGVQRVDVPICAMRVLARIELGSRWEEAVNLQQKVTLRIVGQPEPPEIPRTMTFDIEALPGVTAFDSATLALASEPDINPGMDQLQRVTRLLADAVANSEQRSKVDQVIRQTAWPAIARAMPTLGDGTVQNAWALPSTSGVYKGNWLVRTLINLGGIWANTPDEVIYYKSFVDEQGTRLSGETAYSMRFEAEELPSLFATYFWSVIAVDAGHRRVLPNSLNRFLLNNQSGLVAGDDGSLTLSFATALPEGTPEANWLPTVKGVGYSLTFRFYRPQGAVLKRTYFPPPLRKI